MYHGGKIFLEFLGDAKGSDQISHFQSAEVGDEILVHDKVRESSGIVGGSGDSDQISQSQSAVVGDGILLNETSLELLGNAGGSGQNCGSQDNGACL